jgi:hypothetical protein
MDGERRKRRRESKCGTAFSKSVIDESRIIAFAVTVLCLCVAAVSVRVDAQFDFTIVR